MDNSFLHSKRLLLVDDEQELLKMISDILKDAGFETVLTAMSVKEAILTAKEETPDLIIGVGAWCRRLHFKALYATGITTAYLCGTPANL